MCGREAGSVRAQIGLGGSRSGDLDDALDGVSLVADLHLAAAEVTDDPTRSSDRLTPVGAAERRAVGAGSDHHPVAPVEADDSL